MHSPQRLLTLPAHERRLVFAALPVVVVARLGLCLLPLSQLQRILTWLADATATAPAHGDYARRAARAVQRASRLVPGAYYLTQSLATMVLLRRRGLVGRLRVGAQPEQAGPPPAWVEFGGRVIIGATSIPFAAFAPMPSLKGEPR